MPDEIDQSLGHIDTQQFGTVSFRERSRAPLTGLPEQLDSQGFVVAEAVPAQPELCIYTDLTPDDSPGLRHFRVVDGRGNSWELDFTGHLS